jgi:hypothetical protein
MGVPTATFRVARGLLAAVTKRRSRLLVGRGARRRAVSLPHDPRLPNIESSVTGHDAGKASGGQGTGGALSAECEQIILSQALRVCPETLSWVAKFAEHEAD